MIPRSHHLRQIERLHSVFPVVGIVGARQVGKTTLARMYSEAWTGPVRRFDLEDPGHRAALSDPKLALEDLEGLVVLDEIQRSPGLFPVLRVLVDRPERSTRFLVLGSASPDLLRQGSETLAGRIAYHELPGLGVAEVGQDRRDDLWVRGGFPRSFLAADDGESLLWRQRFLATFLERDLPQHGVRVEPQELRRLWAMLAHYHGQLLNLSELGRALGVSHTTIRHHLDVLVGALMVRELSPWHENLKKRQVKSPKVYLRDSGLLHALLSVRTGEELSLHPKVGASWEGFALEQLAIRLEDRSEDLNFWRAHTGAEVDLLVHRGRERHGFEFKRTSAPKVTRSMRSALADLGLTSLSVVYPGAETFPLADRIRALPLRTLAENVDPLA